MFSFLFLFLFFSFSFSLEIFSGRLEKLPDGRFKATGNVEAYYKEYYIKAEFMTYDPQKRIVYAKEEVYIKSVDGRFEVKGSEALLDLERDVGYFLDAEGRFEKFNFTAKRFEKEGEAYSIQEGSITTCPPDRKEMKLCFSRARVSQRYVFSENNTLQLFRVPIAYLPITLFPVGERRSGLLPPTIGSNTYNTLIYQQPIYWAISKNKDATLTLDLRDKQAKGLSLEYRHSMKKNLDLTGTLSFYKEPTPPDKWWQGRDPSTFRENRYRIKADIDLGDLKVGVDTISDPYFMQDVYFTTRDRTVPYLTSYITYKREWERFLFTFDARRFYDTTSPNNKETLQRLPEIGFYLKDTPVLQNLYFNLSASYTNFYREEGLRAQRLILFPEFSIPKHVFGLNLLSTLTFENIAYMDVKGGRFEDKSIFGSIRYRESLPYFYKLHLGGFDLRNTFELSYSYRPKGFKNPRFDDLDSIDKESLLSYTLKSYGYHKEKLLYSLFLAGGYNHLGRFTYAGQEVREKFLPIRAILWLYPTDWLRLSSDSLYDPVHGRLLRSIGSLTISGEGKSITLGRTLEKNYDGSVVNDQYNLSASALYRNASLFFGIIRDSKVNKDLQRQVGMEYKGACWSLGILLRDIYDGTRQKYLKEVFLTFNVFDLQRFTVPLKR
ncbi:LPS assembly protein LptD [Hydrogenobacter sp. T-2]|uniref:LPS-assembly protein LptD n=1 Tax=Pampinifervens diazotrophicum TaxID=1632018 RepID=UPI002B2588A2|nr:LPS assembly protein LptD [Hydrogenobacter sp. T-2]WPM32334.1 LPS assembly protein LptD [Hydrogenobacter sp. T-2]